MELVVMSSLSLDILSAMTFSIVLIHCAFTPTFELVRRPQKNLAKALPIIDFLLICKVQLSAVVLSVTHKTTRCGSSVTFSVANTTRDEQ